MKSNKISIFSLTQIELTKKISEMGLSKYIAQQIFQWIYQKNVSSFLKMTNLSKSNINLLDNIFTFDKLDLIKEQIDSNDLTTKYLFGLDDKQNIETVLMIFKYGNSLCVSTQVGCNMGCKFCASGINTKIRNLTTNEIVLQVKQINQIKKINNIVFMGIGEPFDNYDNVINAIKIINDHNGLGIGIRHITISTCGLIPYINKIANELPQINLAISLHASNDTTRNKLMPINQKYNLKQLIDVAKEHVNRTKRKISFEYILFSNINDSKQDAIDLCNLLKSINCYVNFIPYNQVNEFNLKPSQRKQEFIDILNKYNIKHTNRLRRGENIEAACGQLRIKHEKFI